MGPIQTSTIEMVATALPCAIWLTPREVQLCLPFHLHRGTVRAILAILVRQGRALCEGDMLQKVYRRPGSPS